MVEEVIYDFYMLWSGLTEICNPRVKAPGELIRCYSWANLMDHRGQETKALPCFPFPSLLLCSPVLVFTQILAQGWPRCELI